MNLIYALTAIHNYIRREAGLRALVAGLDREDTLLDTDEDQELTREGSTSTTMDTLRDSMADRMLRDYSRIIAAD
jgi:hypothetical protein